MEQRQEYQRDEFVYGPVIFVVAGGLLVLYISRSMELIGPVSLLCGAWAMLYLAIIAATPTKIVIDMEHRTFSIYDSWKQRPAVYTLADVTCVCVVKPTRSGKKKVFKFTYKGEVVLNMEYANAGWSDETIMEIHDQLRVLNQEVK